MWENAEYTAKYNAGYAHLGANCLFFYSTSRPVCVVTMYTVCVFVPSSLHCAATAEMRKKEKSISPRSFAVCSHVERLRSKLGVGRRAPSTRGRWCARAALNHRSSDPLSKPPFNVCRHAYLNVWASTGRPIDTPNCRPAI